MKKLFFICFLAVAGVTSSQVTQAQSAPIEIPTAPPAVREAWNYWFFILYYDQFGRFGETTWYVRQGSFESITVFKKGSTFIRVFMSFSPQGELLGTGTDE